MVVKTVMPKEHESTLPPESRILYHTVVVPLLKLVPLASTDPLPEVVPSSLKVTVFGLQLSSVKTGAIPFTSMLQSPAAAVTVVSPGQVIVGGMLSSTVTLALQEAVLPLMSVTVRVTMFTPISVQVKLFGVTLRGAKAQLSPEPPSTSAPDLSQNWVHDEFVYSVRW